MIIFLLLLDIGLANAVPCGMTVRAESGRPCSDYIAMTGSNGKNPLTKEEFIKLNPNIDCENPATKIGEGVEVCLYSDSKFDNPDVQDGTTLEEFLKAAKPLTTGKKRSRYFFDRSLYKFLAKLVKQMGQRRHKRQTTDDLDKTVAQKLANPRYIASIKAVIARNENFKALDDEFQTWRPKMCQEMKTKQKNNYTVCICDATKPFIHCQAILVNEKEEIDQRAMQDEWQNVTEHEYPYTFPNSSSSMRYSRAAEKKWKIGQFIGMLQKGGCANIERCLSHTCFCVLAECQIIPKIPFLSICVNAEACIPSLLDMALRQKNGFLPISLFTESRLRVKVGICLTEFPGLDFLSFLGLDKCLANVIFDFYVLKMQLDISGQIALVAVRAAITVKFQVYHSFSNGIGIPFYVGAGYRGDICRHPKHKCNDYCTMKPGDFNIGYKVEYWWWTWRNWKEGSIYKSKVPPHCR